GIVAGIAAPGLLAAAHYLPDLADLLNPPARIVLPEADTRRIAALAAEKELPIPEFQNFKPADDIAEPMRQFIGVWVSNEAGWSISTRQMMLIVTSVDRRGTVTGFFSNGPAKPFSRLTGPAFIHPFSGKIVDSKLDYEFGAGAGSFTLDGRIEYQKK